MPISNKTGVPRKDPRYMVVYLKELKHWAIDKLGRKCSECGLVSEYDCVYDFHHEGEDSWSKGHYQQSASTKRTKELIKWKKANSIPSDCKLICSNCHRIKHHGN